MKHLFSKPPVGVLRIGESAGELLSGLISDPARGSPKAYPSAARVSGEAPQGLPVEGVLNQQKASAARVSGEAPAAGAAGGGAEPQ